MIQHILSSCILFEDSDQIGSDISPSQMKLLELQFFLFEQKMYDELSKPFLQGAHYSSGKWKSCIAYVKTARTQSADRLVRIPIY